MSGSERREVLHQFYEAYLGKETSSTILKMIIDKPSGFLSYVSFRDQTSDITFGAFHDAVVRINGLLKQSDSGFLVKFCLIGNQSLGVGLTSTDQDHDFSEHSLIDRAREQVGKDILKAASGQFDNGNWTEVGDWRFFKPVLDLSDCPAPCVVIANTQFDGNDKNAVLFLTPLEIAVLDVFVSQGGYIDSSLLKSKIGSDDVLRYIVPKLNREFIREFGKKMINTLRKYGYPGYSIDALESRNAYLRGLIGNNKNIIKLANNSPELIRRVVCWDRNKRLNLMICPLKDALRALGYREMPYYIESRYNDYLLIARRDDVHNGNDFDQTTIIETSDFAFQLVISMVDSAFISLGHYKGYKKSNIKQAFTRVVDGIKRAGYGIEDGTGITTREGVIFPVPYVKSGN